MSDTAREFAGCGNRFCKNCDFYPQCRFAPNLKCDESEETETENNTMKLIIDIDKKIYDRAMLGDFNITVFDEAVRNGIPLEEELEKIKTEIQGLIDFEESCCGNTTLGYQCLGVIDDKISELKGE